MSHPPGAPRRTRDEADALVRRIADMMARGAWVRGMSSRQLARELDEPLPTIRSYAAQASRLVWDDSLEDIAELKASSIDRLGALSVKAEQAGNLRVANELIRTQNEVAGVLRPGQQVNIHLDARGNLRPEVARDARAYADLVRGAYQRAARRLGCAEALEEAYLEEMASGASDAPTLVLGAAGGADGGDGTDGDMGGAG